MARKHIKVWVDLVYKARGALYTHFYRSRAIHSKSTHPAGGVGGSNKIMVRSEACGSRFGGVLTFSAVAYSVIARERRPLSGLAPNQALIVNPVL